MFLFFFALPELHLAPFGGDFILGYGFFYFVFGGDFLFLVAFWFLGDSVNKACFLSSIPPALGFWHLVPHNGKLKQNILQTLTKLLMCLNLTRP